MSSTQRLLVFGVHVESRRICLLIVEKYVSCEKSLVQTSLKNLKIGLKDQQGLLWCKISLGISFILGFLEIFTFTNDFR